VSLEQDGEPQFHRAGSYHDLPYRAMDFADGTRLEIYDEVHVWYESDGLNDSRRRSG